MPPGSTAVARGRGWRGPRGLRGNLAGRKQMLRNSRGDIREMRKWKDILLKAVTTVRMWQKESVGIFFRIPHSHVHVKQAVRMATRYAPAPLLRRGRPSASRAAEQTQRSSGSHAQYVLTVTAAPGSRVKAAVSTAARCPWPLTFWLWKWCPSHVWRGLPLCQFLSS